MMTATHDKIEDRIAVLDDAGLITLVRDLARRVDYYNAAEGSSYANETPVRDLAKSNFWKAFAAMKERGLKTDLTEFML